MRGIGLPEIIFAVVLLMIVTGALIFWQMLKKGENGAASALSFMQLLRDGCYQRAFPLIDSVRAL